MSAEDHENTPTADSADENTERCSGVEVAAQDLQPSAEMAPRRRQVKWPTTLAFGVLPAAAVILGALAGFLKWQDSSHREAQAAAAESVAVARDTTAAMLTYKADTVDQDLNAVRDRLSGSFLDDYAKLVNEVVIPGAKEKKISAVAQAPAAASVSATPAHAVALVFVDQTVTIGNGAPTSSASSVRVTLDKVDGRWLVSGFDPV
jgi:Mce-associated membrane protein